MKLIFESLAALDLAGAASCEVDSVKYLNPATGGY